MASWQPPQPSLPAICLVWTGRMVKRKLRVSSKYRSCVNYEHLINSCCSAMHFLIPLLESCKLACCYGLGEWKEFSSLAVGVSSIKSYILRQDELSMSRGMIHLFLKLCSLPLLKLQVSNLCLSNQQVVIFSPQKLHFEGLSSFPLTSFPVELGCC